MVDPTNLIGDNTMPINFEITHTYKTVYQLTYSWLDDTDNEEYTIIHPTKDETSKWISEQDNNLNIIQFIEMNDMTYLFK